MTDEARERRRNLLWGVPASLIVHALLLTLLVYGLSRPPQQTREEEPVNVSLVPPPDQPKPKPVAPPPVVKAEKPPEPKPPEPVDIPVLKRVFQYGDKDSGPEKSPDGSSAQGNAQSPAKDATPVEPKPAPTAAPKQPDASNADEKPATTPPDLKPAQSEEKQATDEADKQQLEKPPQPAEQASAAPKPLPDKAGNKPAPSSPPKKTKPKPAKTMSFKSAQAFKAPIRNARKPGSATTGAAGSPVFAGLPGVRKLYSQGATGDALATSSMDNVPRGKRVANLCGNILSTELQGAGYAIKWVPTIELDKGNVLNPQQSAFSTRHEWYNLSFRCEVDPDATRVVSFTFRVGALIPPGEWASRGFTPKFPLD
ncbi:DUF930 domain-containing protein [Mesorhizobium sp. ES1-1]|uniref:DUF930 domain-containing protein n=1 Tax=Mesorhizobium sp. ES1-1 TaxID=2876629 RepID=UPI001CC9F03E|nr:DUF930 domain-containing protein [Mesorhizobium sp. ES1-1]MBZ9678210.1 DUF930 domain-containing protein [Mesorhizobium sp. ES1-1]